MLAGVRVVDLSEYGPAARASRLLADYGASVLRLRRPPGLRALAPPESAYRAGAGTVELFVDLRRPEGVEVARRAAAAADVLIESYRPGTAARLGLGPEELRARNPRLVYCSTSGYGQSGPYAAWAGHDLNYQATAAGLAVAGGAPVVPAITIGDGAGGGMHAVIAILAALVNRASTKQGAYLDVAATEGMLYLSSLIVDQAQAGGDAGTLAVIDGSYACYDVYEAADGKWLAVGALEEKFWANLCRALGVPDLVAAHLDGNRQAEAKRRVSECFKQRPRDEWVALLGPLDTCVSPVYDARDVVGDPHLRARGVFVDAGAEAGSPGRTPAERGPVRTAPVLAGTGEPAPHCTPADFGLTEEHLALLRAKGVVT